MGAELTSFQARFDLACAKQDYLWFVAGVLAIAVLLAWWRHPQRTDRRWIAATAVMTLLQSAAGIGAFLFPLVERTRPPPGAWPPHLFADLVMGGAAGFVAIVWTWHATAAWRAGNWLRWLGAALVIALCWLRKDQPLIGGGGIAGVATMLLVLSRSRPQSGALKAAAVLAVAALWLSPWGALAVGTHGLLRYREWTMLGPLCAALLAAAQACALAGLARESLALLPADRGRALAAAARPFVLAGAAWLIAGLFMAEIAGRNSRQNFESSALSRVVVAAATFPTADVAEIVGPAFHPEPARRFAMESGASIPLFVAESARLERTATVRAQLNRLFQLNPELTYVLIALPHDGQLVHAIPMAQAPQNSGIVFPLRPLTTADRDRWASHAPHLEIGTTTTGTIFMARAPIEAPSGEPLAWLQFNFSIGQWAAAQAQARLLAFAVTALGLGLLAAVFISQWRRQEREMALSDAAAATAASRMKTAFLANVSHELRTPLQSILGYAELLRDSLAAEVDRTRLAALRQHGELLIRLVNDLIDLGMLDSGAFRLVERPCSLGRLVREVVESLRPAATARGLDLACEVDAQLPVWTSSDPERLRQIVLNLVGNAVKYTQEGRIDVRVASLSQHGDEHRIELTVTDTGPGIAPAEQAQLFEPFSRLDRTAQQEGTGLGLALSRALCRRLGGDLTVESDGVSGTRFRAVLPMRATTAPVAAPSVGRDALAGWRILVADDNRLVRDLFAAYLGDLGAECLLATDGPAAVARAAETRFNAIVIDLAMPGLDGMEVTRRIRAAGGRQRIVGVSAHGGGLERAQALAAGMDDFLVKPIELPALAAALRPAVSPAPARDFFSLRRREWEDALREELPVALRQLEAALTAGRWDELQRHAHHLKNTALLVRDDLLAAVCHDIESAAEQEDDAAAEEACRRGGEFAARWLSTTHEFRPPSRSLQTQPSHPSQHARP